jgi:hypothetical protein
MESGQQGDYNHNSIFGKAWQKMNGFYLTQQINFKRSKKKEKHSLIISEF